MRALGRAGIDCTLVEEGQCAALWGAIAARGGAVDELARRSGQWHSDLRYPECAEFVGRTRVLALAWCLVHLMRERGEIAVRANGD